MVTPDVLTKMLSKGEMSYRERAEYGLLNHPPIQYEDVLRHLIALIEQNGYFPCRREELDREGGLIEKHDGSKYVYVYQRYHADRAVVAERKELIFHSVRQAAEHYLRWDLHLPHQGLCGIKVEGLKKK